MHLPACWRVCHMEHVLGLVQRGCAPADVPAAIAPALAQAHADLATHLPPSSWASLSRPALNSSQKHLLTTVGDPNVVTRALLAQINYIVDVAANMSANTHTTASGVFRLAWRGRQKSTTIVLRLRTVNMYLAQPVASCLRSPPADTHFAVGIRDSEALPCRCAQRLIVPLPCASSGGADFCNPHPLLYNLQSRMKTRLLSFFCCDSSA